MDSKSIYIQPSYMRECLEKGRDCVYLREREREREREGLADGGRSEQNRGQEKDERICRKINIKY